MGKHQPGPKELAARALRESRYANSEARAKEARAIMKRVVDGDLSAVAVGAKPAAKRAAKRAAKPKASMPVPKPKGTKS